jgi:hypothetical protein
MSRCGLVNLSAADLVAQPSAHFVKDGFLDNARFAMMRDSFPDRYFDAAEVVPFAGARRDLEHGMDSYRQFLRRHPVWQDCLAQLRSRQYAEQLLDIFGPHLRASSGWRKPPRYWRESSIFLRQQRPLGAVLARAATALPGPRLDRLLYRSVSHLRGRFFPDGYSMLCTIASAWHGYAQPAHRDTPDRLVVNLIYFNDPVHDGGGQGGEFCLHRPRAGARLHGGIWAEPDQVERVRTVAPRANLGVGLINAPSLLHSAEPFVAGNEPRRFLYLALAKCDPPYPW